MASIRITIETDGAAFQDDLKGPPDYPRSQETGRILHTLADAIWRDGLRSADLGVILHDKTVGKVEVIE